MDDLSHFDWVTQKAEVSVILLKDIKLHTRLWADVVRRRDPGGLEGDWLEGVDANPTLGEKILRSQVGLQVQYELVSTPKDDIIRGTINFTQSFVALHMGIHGISNEFSKTGLYFHK